MHFGDVTNLEYAVWCVHFFTHPFCFIYSLSQGHARKQSVQTHNLLLISPHFARLHMLSVYVTLLLPAACHNNTTIVYYSLCCKYVSLAKYHKG